MSRRPGWLLVVFGFGTFAAEGLADQFEQLDGPMLIKTIQGPDATSQGRLTVADLVAMPSLLRDSRSALVLAKTDRGNPARLLLVPELRKPAGGAGEPIPVMVLERLDTFDASDSSVRLTTRRDITVFDGFQVDLDSGQVVPDGQGGDVVFRAQGDGGPRLETIGAARLITLKAAPSFDTSKAPQPTPGKAVLPGDFAGRYRLFANGQWSGTLDLKVEARGVVVGKYRSDLHGTTYPVTGQVATDAAQKVLFAIKYPRARQEFEGYLWAEGKGAMAGVASIAERPVGFFAVREGGRFSPEGTEFAPLAADANRPGKHVVEILGTKVKLDGEPAALETLGERLKGEAEAKDEATPWVLVRVSAEQNFRDMIRVVEAIEAAGIKDFRFEQFEAGK